MCRSGDVSNITPVDEWNHACRGGYYVKRNMGISRPPRSEYNLYGLMELRNVAAMIHRHAT